MAGSKVSHGTAIMRSARTSVSSDGSNGERSTSNITHTIVGGFRSLTECWLRVLILHCVLTEGLPQFLTRWASLYRSLQHGPWLSPEWANKKEWERTLKMEVPGFCHLISEVTSHHFCQPTLKEKGSYKGMNTKQQESLGGNLRGNM